MTKKSKTLISILLFVVLFGGLLLTATFTDLQVSDILCGMLWRHIRITLTTRSVPHLRASAARLFILCLHSVCSIILSGCSQILEKTPDKGYC